MPLQLKTRSPIYCLPEKTRADMPDYLGYNKYQVIGCEIGEFLDITYRIQDFNTREQYLIDLTDNMFFREEELVSSSSLTKLQLSRQDSLESRSY